MNEPTKHSILRLRIPASAPWELPAWAVALACAVVPLWSASSLPLVDLPQHLHLISALHRLDDASTLYPDMLARRPELTPYVGYYYAVHWLSYLFPIEVANRLFLSAYVVGLPLSLAFLLRSLSRPIWPALLAVPFAYGDSFAWGFINFCAALPLAITSAGLFVRAIEDAPRRVRWARWLGLTLTLVLLFHIQVFAFLAFALPVLLLTTPAPEGRTWRARLPALLGVLPGVGLFLAWVGVRLGKPTEIAPGQPWKAWGPMFSEQNLAKKSFDQNLSDLVSLGRGDSLLERIHFPVLGNITHDGADKAAVLLALGLAVVAFVLGLGRGSAHREGPVARLRLPLLFGVALAMFFLLPFDIRGYSYYLNTRYAHLAAALFMCMVPPLVLARARAMVLPAMLVGVVTMLPLRSAFHAFDAEAQALARLAERTGEKPRVMGLLFGAGSSAVRYPVHLHAACALAREKGGITNFSFATTPHSPLMYKVPEPPTFPSEWRPQEMRWATQGSYYDHFLVRGREPKQVFGRLLGSELEEIGYADGFYLVRKKR
jgi:hypothetical protein